MKDVQIPMKFDEEALKNLRAQKSELVKGIELWELPDTLFGIVHLIDHIQDYLADNQIFPENVVFDKGLPPETKDHWESDPIHRVEDWQYEVANNDTRLGYHEWVEKKKEENE